MKKNLVLGAVFAAALFAVSPAKAIDSTGGCGLGSMAWRGQSGIIPQVLAMTTNGIFLNTIGVTLALPAAIRTDALPAVRASWFWP